MCTIIVKKANVKITKEKLRFCWESNKDGAGYMFAHPERQNLIIRKGFMTFKDFYAQWVLDKSFTNLANTVLHFRVATKGKINIANCHPHRVSNYMALAHNGTLEHFKGAATDEVSDSRVLARFLKGLPNNWWKNGNVMKMLELSIGSNKVVLMNRFDQLTILNESLGEWEKDLWFSNKYHRVARYYTPPEEKTVVTLDEIVSLGLGNMDRYCKYHYHTVCKDPRCGFPASLKKRYKARLKVTKIKDIKKLNNLIM